MTDTVVEDTPVLQIRSVLCPVDFSDGSRRALQYASRVAASERASLAVLTVIEKLLAQAAAVAYDVDLAKTEVSGELEQFVRGTLDLPSESHAPDLEVVVGDSADRILEVATRRDTSLIVMGTHGLSGYKKLFFGSVTQKVLQRTPAAVLVIPAMIDERGAGAAGSWPPSGTIVVALDLHGPSDEYARTAAMLAARSRATVLLLHAIEQDEGDAHAAERTAAAALASVAARLPPTCASEIAVVHGTAADRIVEIATSRRASLLVMGLQRGEGIRDRTGKTAYQVLCRTSAPVLALPTAAR